MSLLDSSAGDIAAMIAAGTCSSADATQACIERCDAVHPSINAVVVPLFDEALAAARTADEQRARVAPLGPLHGVPITLKECFHLRGTPATMGLTALEAKLSASDGPLVARLKAAGAIILGKTNVPQLMLSHETANPLYGQTNNPWNLDRTPGGSSGGEAAIIAAGGSFAGLGSDMGGSIRLPAHFCGVAGLKPTAGRLTNRGSVTNLRGMQTLSWQAGPLARRVADVALLFRVLCGDPEQALADEVPAAPRDPARVAMAGLRVGYWEDNGNFPYAPAVKRAVREAVAALAAQGALVEPLAPPKVAEAQYLFTATMAADGGADSERLLRGSKIDPPLSQLLLVGRIPNLLRPLVAWGVQKSGQYHRSGLVRAAKPRSADEYWQLTKRIVEYRRAFLDDFAAKYDALVLPPYALPAPRHGQGADLFAAAGDTLFVNLLGVPAGVVPVTRVRAGEESDRPPSKERAARTAREAERESAGLPVGVQVVSHYWREDIVLAVMSAIEGACREASDFPRTPIVPTAAP